MRVLFLSPNMNRVGTWFRTFGLARGLARRGHDVTIFKVSPDRRIVPARGVESGVVVWELPRFYGWRFSHHGSRQPVEIAARLGLLARARFDIAHSCTHFVNALLPTLVAGATGRARRTLTDRDDLWTDGGLAGDGSERRGLASLDYRFQRYTERTMARWVDGTTVVSADLAERVRAAGVPEERIARVVNGCPVDRLVPGDRGAARAHLLLDPTRPLLLFVGVGQYDVDLVLSAVKVLRRRGMTPFPETLLLGPNKALLDAGIAAAGLVGDVRAPGFVPDAELPFYLQAADVGLMPYADKALNRARWPIKVGDYLSTGLPVVTNDVGEMGPLIREAAAGAVTAPTAEAFADGIVDTLRPENAARYAIRARAFAERLSWDAVAVDLEAFYGRILALPPARR